MFNILEPIIDWIKKHWLLVVASWGLVFSAKLRAIGLEDTA